MDERITCDVPLKDAGFEGEFINDEKVWIVYTHFPILTKYEFDASRIVLGVRCPLDVIDSFFNLTMTRTHSKTLEDGEYLKY